MFSWRYLLVSFSSFIQFIFCICICIYTRVTVSLLFGLWNTYLVNRCKLEFMERKLWSVGLFYSRRGFVVKNNNLKQLQRQQLPFFASNQYWTTTDPERPGAECTNQPNVNLTSDLTFKVWSYKKRLEWTRRPQTLAAPLLMRLEPKGPLIYELLDRNHDRDWLTVGWYKSSHGIAHLPHKFGYKDCNQTTHSTLR